MILPRCTHNVFWLYICFALRFTRIVSFQMDAYRYNKRPLSTPFSGSVLTRQMSTHVHTSTTASLDGLPISNFQKRLLERMKASNKKAAALENTQKHMHCPTIPEIRTPQEFKRSVIDEANGQMVVVWFYAPWCRTCMGVSKGVLALSLEHQNVKFYKVPVLAENAKLHQGLDVNSVPYVHLYHPTAGLVEERKLTRKHLAGFRKLLTDCQNGTCSLVNDKEWSTSSPYEPPPKQKDDDEDTEMVR